MKLITLNLWGGKIFEPLMKFLEKHSVDTDIFCFQEILFGPRAAFTPVYQARENIFTELQQRLFDFTAVTYPAPDWARYFQDENLAEDVHPGQAIFVRKNLSVTRSGGFRLYEENNLPQGMDRQGGSITGSCQWVETCDAANRPLTVLNVHGMWQRGTSKGDTPERLQQSRILGQFLDARKSKKILCGDFNLSPDTESVGVLQENMLDLIKQFYITSTRSSLYPKQNRMADYVFVSPDITINTFQVLPDEVSDHLPLVLDFD